MKKQFLDSGKIVGTHGIKVRLELIRGVIPPNFSVLLKSCGLTKTEQSSSR